MGQTIPQIQIATKILQFDAKTTLSTFQLNNHTTSFQKNLYSTYNIHFNM